MPGASLTDSLTERRLLAETLAVVRDMLIDVIGREYLVGLTIDLDTSFDVDLQLESLEFVALAEQLVQRYGDRVDFVAWLASLELDEIIALTVGDLVAFVASSLEPGLETPAPASDAPVAAPGTGQVN